MQPEFISGEHGQRLTEIVGKDQIEGVLKSFANPKTTSFRINTIRGSVSETISAVENLGVTPSPVAWCEEAFLIPPEQRSRLTHSELADDGSIYVQGLSSIFASTVLRPEPEQWNLDLASAPGGKASHMAALMDNRGKLSVVEPIKPRMYRLADNLKRLGVTISRTYLMDGRKVGRKVPDRFDCVMLDAPCSSDSRIRADNPDSWKFWSERKVREQARKQKGLIVSAFQSLKPGGTLLYCTCSFSPEENEAVVSHLMDATDGDATPLPIEMPFDNWQPGINSFRELEFDDAVSYSRRVLPNEHFDAFFLARFTKQRPNRSS
ncbi:RsmB/NOP family class I SAM-dependent RNA methyltransferase [Mariniblastus fucicola]|uniref:Ribosomal RNA small subunit methyltransferase F n=1 Tax=Mariniblastus fucicola TaxID=980251 RepID=A0A5B9PA51_9BACT|nr:RsmB/NOP family class I SAM-dependent RNA methyltransferase [Mariniblastus fucicola]QEG22369.1 Ribosomal RNA small subunit methyltransferase F [Mariniblastus fucicola]